MNEKEIMNLLNSIDDDLVDKKIDDLLNEKGVCVNMNSIKEKALNKLKEKEVEKRRMSKKPFIAAAVVATLTISTIYASEISSVIKSFFNKSVVYSTVIDGDAYYLPEEVKLNEKFTLLNVSVSKDKLQMTVKSNEQLNDTELENLNVEVIPMNNQNIRYKVGGYMLDENENFFFSFYNEAEDNYDIAPFQDFKFMINETVYDISLAKAENIKVDGNLVVGKSEDINTDESIPLIANVAGTIEVKDNATNIQLITSFNDPDLKLSALGELDFKEFNHRFENNKDMSIVSSGNSSMTKPILAYDQDNNPYTLQVPKNAVGRPITMFETNAKLGTNLTVKLPAVVASYEKNIENLNLTIPKEGEVAINKELDFIIQKANVISIKRISKDTAVVEFELNTGNDKTVSIVDIGAYSKDIIKAETTINGNIATMTMTFDENIEEANLEFSYPNYIIQGNWSIELGEVK